MTENVTGPIPSDSLKNHWTNTILPDRFRPYARLARWERPIGWWLLLWPCCFSAALAGMASGAGYPNLWHLLLFLIGAVTMRGAGCTYNDIVDREIDAQVSRTKSRPLPSGAVSVWNAKVFMVIQSLIGFLVLVQFNSFSIALGIASLAVVTVYPFMKRITSWPQFVLGLAFNWGALMGWAAVFGEITLAPVLLYCGGVAWTIAYDTIYAHQDQEDDAVIGVKSTARLFGKATKPLTCGFFTTAVLLFATAGYLAAPTDLAKIVVVVGMFAPAAHAIWQMKTLDPNDTATCLMLFRSNQTFGLLVFAVFLIGGFVTQF